MAVGKIRATTLMDGVYLVQFLDDPGPIKLPPFPALNTTLTRAVRGSWRLQIHLVSAFARGVQRNVDESRGVVVDIADFRFSAALDILRTWYIFFLTFSWTLGGGFSA